MPIFSDLYVKSEFSCTDSLHFGRSAPDVSSVDPDHNWCLMIHYSIVDHVDAWDMCDGILVTTDVLILPRAYVDLGEIVDGVGPLALFGGADHDFA